MFTQLQADYQRHGRSLLNPALWAVWNYHYGVWALKIKFSPFRWLSSKVYGLNMFLILLTSGIRLHREAKIGADLHLVHSGNINIHPSTIIGERCGILHDVTIGSNMDSGAPIIGDDVFIGAGAKILGNIKIGDGVTISANSLVLKDVPPGVTAIGVPARSINYANKRNIKS